MLADENDGDHDRRDDEYEDDDPQPSVALPTAEPEHRPQYGARLGDRPRPFDQISRHQVPISLFDKFR
jgi:hypothetical protein